MYINNIDKTYIVFLGCLKMKVSFIIVNYNGKNCIEACLDSILQQNFPKKQFEIIVVDNNSPDKSWKLVKGYEKVRLIKSNENQGFAKANNIGIKQSSGKYLALVNNDVTLEKNWLKKMISRIEKDKWLGAVGCKLLYPNSDRVWFGGGKVYFPGFPKHLNLKEETFVDYVAFAAVIIKKRYGGYLDENIFMYGEDIELCKRIRMKGFKILYCPSAIAYHHITEDRISGLEEYSSNRNRGYYFSKFYGPFGKTIFLIGDILFFFPCFVAYRMIKDPRRIKFWREVIRARKDSIGLLLK